jgi:hypothetical protein
VLLRDFDRTLLKKTIWRANIRSYLIISVLPALFIVAVMLILGPSLAISEPIYKKINPDGSVVFSSTPPEAGATPVTLPQIKREPAKKINVVPTCSNHGGINCDAGSDDDGSVICYDGFRDGTERFSFKCTAARLETLKVLSENGEILLVVRNTTGVEAKEVAAKMKYPAGSWIVMTGPSTVPPFGMAEYRAKGSGNPSTTITWNNRAN